MAALDRIYGQWTKDLAPGIVDRSSVVRDRIIYRAAEEKSQGQAGVFQGDEMGVDLGAFQLPVSDAPGQRVKRPKDVQAQPAPQSDSTEEMSMRQFGQRKKAGDSKKRAASHA